MMKRFAAVLAAAFALVSVSALAADAPDKKADKAATKVETKAKEAKKAEGKAAPKEAVKKEAVKQEAAKKEALKVDDKAGKAAGKM